MLPMGLRFASLSFVIACVSGSGCAAGPEDPPSVASKSADEQAEIAVDVACEYTARCGIVSVACADCDGDDCGGCIVEVETITYDDCVQEIGSEYEERFACEALTASQAANVDECLAALVDLPCPDPAELEAWANGELDGDRPGALPSACDATEEIGQSCEDELPGGDEGMEPDPG